MPEIDYKNMTRSQLAAVMDEEDEKSVKRSVLRELYDKKLRE